MSARRNDEESAIDERTLVITRVLDAPRGLVFRAFTEREHIVEWMAPQGFTIPFCEGEARVGALWRCCMRAPDGVEHWVGGVYREIVENERLVFTHAWDDEAGARGHETIVTITLAEDPGGTRLTLRQASFASKDAREGHGEGWGECLDKLAELLAGRMRKEAA